MTALTDRQREVLGFMLDFCVNCRRPPSTRETGYAIGVPSNNGVADHLRCLRRKGYVAQVDGDPRNAWWPVRDLDGAPIRWRLTYERSTQ